MNILILGASGYVGSHCVKVLKNKKNKIFTQDKTGNVDILGDLSDFEFVKKLPSVDIVINCAAVQYHSKDIPLFFRKSYFYKNNVQSVININNRYKNENIHLIHFGSSMMFFNYNKIIYCEKDKMIGTGVYSKTKIDALRMFKDIKKLSVIIPSIIGSEEREGIFKSFITTIIKYKMLVIPGNGEKLISMVHVSDVVDFISLIVEKSKFGIFNVAAAEPLTINEWIKYILNELEIKNYRRFKIPIIILNFFAKITCYRFIAKEQILMLNQSHTIDSSKALSIGWKPNYNNKDIINGITRGVKNTLKKY